MKAKSIVLCTLITMFITGLVFVMGVLEERSGEAKEVYQIYLDGKKLGAIVSESDLYNLIDKEQSSIKKEYNVKTVYPPNGFEITRNVTYDEKINDVKEVYNEIKEEKPFTVKGYVFTIKYPDKDKKNLKINVLDKKIFTNALNNLITSFIPSDKYQAYLKDEQVEIVDTGSLIETIYFEESITVKESYIGVGEKIFTDEQELSQYLMFGSNDPQEEYTVDKGDTIESISYDHKLNTQEFLIANPKFSSSESLLSIGQKVNVSLIDPVITLTYEMHVVEDMDIDYETDTTYDETEYTDYEKVTQEGKKGVNRITKKVKYSNGEENQGAVIVSYETLKEPQTKKVVKGSKKRYYGGRGGYVTGTYVDTGDTWAWPTNSPYILTSPFGYRWGSLHEGMDISGTGYGSPIYASLGGVVVNAGYGGMVGSSSGYNVVIKHDNGYYTVYAHMSTVGVSKGQTVSRGQRIGAMGQSGFATGTHLHFAVYRGEPYGGGVPFNPLQLWQ